MLIPLVMLVFLTTVTGCILVFIALTKSWQLKIFNNMCLYKVGAILVCSSTLLILCMTGAVGYGLIAGQQLC